MITVDLAGKSVHVAKPSVEAKVDARKGTVIIGVDRPQTFDTGGGGEDGRFMGAWQPDVQYPPGATVQHRDGTWGAPDGANMGVEPKEDLIGVVPVGSDAFANAAVITSYEDGTVLAGTTFGGEALTMEADEPKPHYRMTQTAWWVYQPITSGYVTFDTGSSTADTIMGLYLAPDGPTTDFADLVLLAYDDDGGGGLMSRIGADVAAGTTLYIQVGSYFNDQGLYCLNLTNARRTTTSGPPPTNPWMRLSVSRPGIAAFVDGRIQDHKMATDPHHGYVLDSGDSMSGVLVLTGAYENAGYSEGLQVFQDARVGGRIVFGLGPNGPSVGGNVGALEIKTGMVNLINSPRITGLTDPIGAQDAATKHYVDIGLAAGGGGGSIEIYAPDEHLEFITGNDIFRLSASGQGYADAVLDISARIGGPDNDFVPVLSVRAGRVYVPYPQEAGNAATKEYVDEAVAALRAEVLGTIEGSP